MRRPPTSFLVCFFVYLSMVCVNSAGAQPLPITRHGDLEVAAAWARATPPAARTGAVYVTLINHGQAADRLLSASSSAAARAELHAHLNEGGVMRMKALDVIVLAPGERVSLHPSGLHVMLVDLKAPLREGTRLTLTLGFAKAGEVTLEVPVLRNPPAEAGPGH